MFCAYRPCRAGIYALKLGCGARGCRPVFIVFAETETLSKTPIIWDAVLKPFFVRNMTCGRSYFALLANWPLRTEPQITALRVAASRRTRLRQVPDVFSKLQHREF